VLPAGLSGGERTEWMAVVGTHLVAPATTQFGRRCPNPCQGIRPGTQRRRCEGWSNKAGYMPHLPTFLRHSLARRRLRYSNGTRTLGP